MPLEAPFALTTVPEMGQSFLTGSGIDDGVVPTQRCCIWAEGRNPPNSSKFRLIEKL